MHPQYREVVFQDTTAGTTFLTRSTIPTSDTITWDDGETYPLAKVEISKESHPFFTGTMQIVDTAGRVERFERRYGRRKGGDDAPADEAAPAAEEAAPEPAAAEAPAEAPEAPAAEAPAAEAEAEGSTES